MAIRANNVRLGAATRTQRSVSWNSRRLPTKQDECTRAINKDVQSLLSVSPLDEYPESQNDVLIDHSKRTLSRGLPHENEVTGTEYYQDTREDPTAWSDDISSSTYSDDTSSIIDGDQPSDISDSDTQAGIKHSRAAEAENSDDDRRGRTFCRAPLHSEASRCTGYDRLGNQVSLTRVTRSRKLPHTPTETRARDDAAARASVHSLPFIDIGLAEVMPQTTYRRVLPARHAKTNVDFGTYCEESGHTTPSDNDITEDSWSDDNADPQEYDGYEEDGIDGAGVYDDGHSDRTWDGSQDSSSDDGW